RAIGRGEQDARTLTVVACSHDRPWHQSSLRSDYYIQSLALSRSLPLLILAFRGQPSHTRSLTPTQGSPHAPARPFSPARELSDVSRRAPGSGAAAARNHRVSDFGECCRAARVRDGCSVPAQLRVSERGGRVPSRAAARSLLRARVLGRGDDLHASGVERAGYRGRPRRTAT